MPTEGSYSGKDVLGNNYSLSIGNGVSASFRSSRSVAARSAVVGDNYTFEITTRDGTKRTNRGKVTGINTDGTLILKPNDSSADEFAAIVGGSDLNSIAGAYGGMAQIPFDDNSTITPRSFDEIYLRAIRWENGPDNGEVWGSGMSVLVKDFPTNISRLERGTTNRYTMTLSGTSDVALDYLQLEVQGLKHDGAWFYLGGNLISAQIPANTPFTTTRDLTINWHETDEYHDLLEYKEIIMQITNVMYREVGTDIVDNGGIPEDIPDGHILATISNFNISLRDTSHDDLLGNLGDFSYGFAADGLSVDYTQAVWKLTGAELTTAKQGGLFEFIVLEGNQYDDGIPHAHLEFVWQDPVNGLWWQDVTEISQWEDTAWALQGDAFSWDPRHKKYSIDLSKVIKDNRFNSATEINLIIICHHYGSAGAINIDQLEIAGANITIAPRPTTGNMGNYSFGYKEDGISPNYSQALWHLAPEVLTIAKESGAKLEIVFGNSFDFLSENPALSLVWQDIDSQRWGFLPEGGFHGDFADLIIYGWDANANSHVFRNGVSYDPGARKLTIILDRALETYDEFADATNVNLIFYNHYYSGQFPQGVNINQFNIVSANIVEDDGSELVITNPVFADVWGNPPITADQNGFFLFDSEDILLAYAFPAGWNSYEFVEISYTTEVVDASGEGNKVTVKRPKGGEMYNWMDGTGDSHGALAEGNGYPWLNAGSGTLTFSVSQFDGCIGFQPNMDNGNTYKIKITQIRFHD
jgi:hypothetical protein